MLTPEQIQQRVRELGEWFHNLDLGGIKTAPQHSLGDYPMVQWRRCGLGTATAGGHAASAPPRAPIAGLHRTI